MTSNEGAGFQEPQSAAQREAWLRFDDVDDVDADTWQAVARAREALRNAL